jgi:predicted GNAT family N-acyltransferase
MWELDNDHTTWHVAAFGVDKHWRESGEAVCCASFFLNTFEQSLAYQLRGMATDPEYHGWGFGREVLRRAEQNISRIAKVRLFWCNARSEAVGFYKKQGWAVVSEEFDIPDVGPHFKMIRRI